MPNLPILFSAPMVRAILREIEQPGTGKTQTRRVLDAWCDEPPAFVDGGVITAYDELDRPYRWPRTKAVGDRLYVREAWNTWGIFDDLPPSKLTGKEGIAYAADMADPRSEACGRLRASMHMPRWASRLTLTVTDVRVQRLQDISREDAMAEGIVQHGRFYGLEDADWDDAVLDPREAFGALWQSINGARGFGWYTNPWVVAYTFRPILGNIDQVPDA